MRIADRGLPIRDKLRLRIEFNSLNGSPQLNGETSTSRGNSWSRGNNHRLRVATLVRLQIADRSRGTRSSIATCGQAGRAKGPKHHCPGQRPGFGLELEPGLKGRNIWRDSARTETAGLCFAPSGLSPFCRLSQGGALGYDVSGLWPFEKAAVNCREFLGVPQVSPKVRIRHGKLRQSAVAAQVLRTPWQTSQISAARKAPKEAGAHNSKSEIA